MEYKNSPNRNKLNSSDFPERKGTHMFIIIIIIIIIIIYLL